MNIRLNGGATLALLMTVRAGAQTPLTPPAPATRGGHAVPAPHVTAMRVETPPRIDGVLDDAVWATATAVSGFTQSEPRTGEAATEATEVRLLFDGRALYVAAYLHDRDASRRVVNDIRKDFKEDDQDTFELLIDTFHDRTNGYVFMTNAEGARSDKQVANEGREVNTSWDGLWTVRTKKVADGWTLEMEIPFSTLRFDATSAEDWGINFSRRIRSRNEIDFWAPVPRQYNLARVSLAGTLEGLGTISAGRDIRLKPYVAASSVRETGVARFDNGADAGLDVKAGITRGLTLDLTIHPDFAQVEADEQTVNLTQFSQFFPEKREFFLENSGIFYVGDAARSNRVFQAPTPDEDLLLFFSRRIGLTAAGKPVSIPGGVRLTGKAGAITLGGLAMRTSTDFPPAPIRCCGRAGIFPLAPMSGSCT